jgi:hypothetical protein
MPPFKKNPGKKPSLKGNGKKKKSYKNYTVIRPRPIINKRTFVKLPYATELKDVTTTTSFALWQFRSNSIYDPDFTSIGHQPRGHDEWAVMYRSYRVHGVLVEVFGNVFTTGMSSIFGIYPHRTTAYPSTVEALMESPDAKYKMVGDDEQGYIKKYVSNAHIFGVSKSQYKNDLEYASAFGASPIKEGSISVLFCNQNMTTSTSHNLRVKLTYMCELFDPVLLAQS